MSNSSRVQLAGIEESTLGVTPSAALQAIRYNSENLGVRKETQRSEEVRQDAQTTDIVEVGKMVDGGFDFESSSQAHDNYMAGALRNDFSADSGFSAATVSAAATGNSINDSANGFPNVVAGQWIRVAGFATAANNGWFEVVSRTAGQIVLTGGTLVDEAAGQTVTITDSTLTNAVQEKSFSFEKFMSDITQYYGFTGCRINTFSLSIQSRQRVTGNFGVMGISGGLTQATIGTGPYSAAPTRPVLNASRNVARLLEGGAVLGTGVWVQQLSFEVNNNAEDVPGVGSEFPVEIQLGRFNITGSMSALFQNEVLFEKYLNHTQSGIVIATEDANGNGYLYSFPTIYYTNGDVTGVGNDDQVTADLEWEAVLNPAQGIMMRIDRS